MQAITQRLLAWSASTRPRLLAALWMGAGMSSLAADLSPRPLVHPLFSDHMVLQRGERIPVWGWAAPDTPVAVRFAEHSVDTRAGRDGHWLAYLPPLRHGGPFEMEIVAGQTVTLTNLLVGDVWLCSGQSNMEMGIGEVREAAREIAAANYERIRLFSVPKQIATEPQILLDSHWKPCRPDTIVLGDYGGFTAAGYFFGRELHRELGVPIGLIDSTWGGTVAEAWTSGEALATLEDFHQALEQLAEITAQLRAGGFNLAAAQAQWYRAVDPGSVEGTWSRPDLDASEWNATRLPGAWEQGDLGQFDGIVWFRKEFDLPPGAIDGDTVLSLGPIDDQDTTWVNGVLVGSTDLWTQARTYRLPSGSLREGRNTVAVRVLDTGGGGGFVGEPSQLYLETRLGEATSRLDLSGDWRFRKSTALGEGPPRPQRLDNNPNTVTVLFNGMIAPLLPYPIKGAIWYQGESNAGRAAQYQRLLPTMIRDWRRRFGVGEFPFLIVQLANFMAVESAPVDSAWAELREAQWWTARRVPNTGLAVAIDIGEANDIHPRNKQEVGRRLALAARAVAYGQDIPYSGPSCRSLDKEGNRLRVHFDHANGGLVVQGGGKLQGFALAGVDGRFAWAEAVVDGETVVVSSPDVENPLAVRYAWANNPLCNLANRAGLPAIPFRATVGK